MKISKLVITSLLTILSFTACEDLIKPINFKTYEEIPKLVVHGFISIKDGVLLQVDKTVNTDKQNLDNTVKNISALLVINSDSSITLEKQSENFFISPKDFKAQYHTLYKIRVQAPGFETVESNSQEIPALVNLDSVHIDTIETFGTAYEYFKDNALTEDYYETNYLTFHQGDTLKNFKTLSNEYFSPFDIYSDYASNGLNYVISQQLNFPQWQDSLVFEFRLYHLAPDLAKFIKSNNDYDFTKQDLFFDQQSPIYSNIKNGYGIFSAYSYDTLKVNYINPIADWWNYK